jgi:hypothetical protein
MFHLKYKKINLISRNEHNDGLLIMEYGSGSAAMQLCIPRKPSDRFWDRNLDTKRSRKRSSIVYRVMKKIIFVSILNSSV